MMLFVDLSIISALFLFLAPASSTLPEQTSLSENGYDCGKFFFTDQMIKTAIQEAFSHLGRKLVIPYVGPLYSRTMSLYTWPLNYRRLNSKRKFQLSTKIWRNQVYQVVFTEYGEAVDVIVKIANNDFARCSRIDNSQPKVQLYEVEQRNDYLCGQKFISNEDILISHQFATRFIGKDKEFPTAYTGNLYNPNAGFLIWPIYKGQEFYRSGLGPSPYFIVMDPMGRIQDVIVKTVKQKSFVRCMKTRKDLSPLNLNAASSTAAGSSDTVGSSTPKKKLLAGFMCNLVFFSDYNLEIARDLAKKSIVTGGNNLYPKIHNGAPFDSTCLFWPVRPSGSPHGPGRASKYRLVLTPDFQIMSVVMVTSIIKKCERKTITDKVSYQDKSSYYCGDKVFSNHELLLTAKVACQKINRHDTVYPQFYEEQVFEVEGPYIIYPLLKGKFFRTFPGKNFLVMNNDCLVAGALTTDSITDKLIRCIPIQ